LFHYCHIYCYCWCHELHRSGLEGSDNWTVLCFVASVNCFTAVIYIVIVGVMMCCECCFTTIIYNVMIIALSSCCMYIWNKQSIAAQVVQGSSCRNLFSALIYKHVVVSMSKWLAPIPIC
jgi:hypothetical protein